MMMVLLILKIIGCILLALILLLILFLLLLLFVPVRYRISASPEEESRIQAAVTWLLHLIALKGEYRDGKLYLILRVLFFRRILLDTAQATRTAEEEEKKAVETLREAAEEVRDESNLWEIPESEDNKEAYSAENNAQQSREKDNEPLAGNHNESAVRTSKSRRRKKKIPVFVQLLKDFIRHIQEIWGHTNSIIDKIQEIGEDSKRRRALKHLKEELFLFLKMLWPRKLRMNIRFSAGSPDKTGQILGVCAMFPITYTEGNILIPDFETENAYVKGYANLKGRVYLYQLVAIVIRIMIDKDCRRLLHQIQSMRS